MGTSYKVRPKSMHKWMACEMERLSKKLERLKPSGCGYNRIQPIVISKSVTHMLNNPLPHPLDATNRGCMLSASTRSKGVLRRSTEAELEEAYPTVRYQSRPGQGKEGEDMPKKFTFYRNCSTRIA